MSLAIRLLPILFVVSALVPAPARAAPDAFVETALPFGVFDEERRTAFLTDARGRVVARDAGSGEVVWRSDVRGRPLAFVDGRVAVQVPSSAAPQVRVLFLDAADGEVKVRSSPVRLPGWARPTQEGDGFLLRSAAIDDGDALVLSWEAQSWYVGGVMPTPDLATGARAEGRARIDRATGNVSQGAARALSGWPSDEGRRRATRASPLPVDGGLVFLEARQEGGARALVLVSQTAAGETSRPLATARHLEWSLTRDLRHVAVTARGGAGADGGVLIFSLSSGERIGRTGGSSRDVFVEGRRAWAFVQAPIPYGMKRTVVAYDLESGAAIWSHRLPDLRIPPPRP